MFIYIYLNSKKKTVYYLKYKKNEIKKKNKYLKKFNEIKIFLK